MTDATPRQAQLAGEAAATLWRLDRRWRAQGRTPGVVGRLSVLTVVRAQRRYLRRLRALVTPTD